MIYKIVKQAPSDNDKWYVKYSRDSGNIILEKKTKKIIVIDSSDNKKK